MKTPSIIHVLALVGVATLSLALSPVLSAQTSTPNSSTDATQSSKAPDSTADKNSGGSSGSPMEQPSTLNQTSSRNTTNSLDMNPSTAPTDSAEKSATKNPTATTTEQGVTTKSDRSERTSDHEFILTAAQGGMTEVELGKLAQERAASPEVKQFGSHMVMDHSKANDELKTIAEKKGVTLPNALDAKHQASVDRFQHLSGRAFDRAYVKAMVKDHEKDAAEFRQASTTARDPDVKNFAGNTLKVIETHLSDIKSIESNMK